MTLSITFYDDIKYHRMDFINRDLDFIGNGVVNLTDFPITYPSPANMNLSLGQGIAWVDGYRIPNDNNLVTVTVPSADTTYPRIDIIQIGHDDINQTYSLVVKKGVPAASPIEPGADPNYVKLYAINVAANATSITSANVIDRRVLVPLKVSGVQIQYQGAASTGANTFTGDQTIDANMVVGSNNENKLKVNAIIQRIDTRSTIETYDANGNLTQIVEKDGATAVKTTTFTYTSGNLTQVQEVVGGNTITTTLTYDVNNILTGTSRAVI